MDYLATKLLGWLMTVLNALFELFSNTLIDMFAIQKGDTLKLFFQAFPVALEAFKSMSIVAYGIVILIMVFQIGKNFFPGLTKGEPEPTVKIFMRSVIALSLVAMAPLIVNAFLYVATTPYHHFATLQADSGTFDTTITVVGAALNGIALMSGSVFLTTFITLILMYTLFRGYVMLVFEVVERYVLLGILALSAPLSLATVTSVSTQDIAGSWFKLMISQMILMVTGVMFLRIFHDGLSRLPDAPNFFAVFLMLITWLRTGTRMDQHIGKLGLSAMQAGGGLGMDLWRSAAGGSKFGLWGANQVSKAMGSDRSFDSVGDLLSGTADALKGDISDTERRKQHARGEEGSFAAKIKNEIDDGSKPMDKSDLHDILQDDREHGGKFMQQLAQSEFGGEGLEIDSAVAKDGKLTATGTYEDALGNTSDLTLGVSETRPDDETPYMKIGEGDEALYLTAQGEGAEEYLNGSNFDDLTGEDALARIDSNSVAIDPDTFDEQAAAFQVQADDNGSFVETGDGTYGDISHNLDSDGNLRVDAARYDSEGKLQENGDFIKTADGTQVKLGEGGALPQKHSVSASANGDHAMSVDGKVMKGLNGQVQRDSNGNVLTADGKTSIPASQVATITAPSAGDKIVSSDGKQVTLGEQSFNSAGALQRYSKDASGKFVPSSSANATHVLGSDGKHYDVSKSLNKDGSMTGFKTGALVRVADSSGTLRHGGASYAKVADPKLTRYVKNDDGTYTQSHRGTYIKTDTPGGYSKLHSSSLNENVPGEAGVKRFFASQTSHANMSLDSADGKQKVKPTFDPIAKPNANSYVRTSDGTYAKIHPNALDRSGKLKPVQGKRVPVILPDGTETMKEFKGSSPRFFNKGHAIAGIPTDEKGNIKLDSSVKMKNNKDGSINLDYGNGRKLLLVSKNTNTLESHVPRSSVAVTKFSNGSEYFVMDRTPFGGKTLATPGSFVKKANPKQFNQALNELGTFTGLNMRKTTPGTPVKHARIDPGTKVPKKEFSGNMVYKKENGKYIAATTKDVKAFQSGKRKEPLYFGVNEYGHKIKSSKRRDDGTYIPSRPHTDRFEAIDTRYNAQGMVILQEAKKPDGTMNQVFIADASRFIVEGGKKGKDYFQSQDKYGRQVYIINGKRDAEGNDVYPNGLSLTQTPDFESGVHRRKLNK